MLTLQEILAATKGKILSKGKTSSFSFISTDSRNIKKGCLFLALVGQKFDGHKFIEEAFKKGAGGVIVSKAIKSALNNKTIIKVKDTEKAFQDIALCHRRKFKIKMIGITGSSGKTTTKDMLSSILSQQFKVLKNTENYNNEIGVPMTLLQLNKTHKAAVIEMAMQKLGEIDELARIVLPDVAIITNIGEAHMEFLNTKENVAKAKSEILKFIKPKGFAILPADDEFYDYLKKRAQSKIISFGINNKADISSSNIKIEDSKVTFILNLHKKQFQVSLPVPGIHNIYNALAASAAAYAIGIKPKSIIKGLSKFKLSSKRMEIFETVKGIRVINDSYNANPSSMKAAIKVLSEQGPVVNVSPSRKIAILGDMLELGKRSKEFHRSIGRLVADSKIDVLLTKGFLSKEIASAAKNTGMKSVYHFRSNDLVINKLKQILSPNDVILAKGSRSMKMEEIANFLKE